MKQGELFFQSTDSWIVGAQLWNPQTAVPSNYTNINDTASNSTYISQLFNYGRFNASTLNDSFAAVAHSASVYIRQNGGNGRFSDPALGTAEAYVTVYQMRWVWLTYVVVAIAMALSFFIPTTAILLKDRDRPEKDWKGNILPLLLYNLDDSSTEIKAMQQNKMKLDDIERMAKKQRVSLTLTANGWKFSRVASL